ncbi:hypothetical protein Droror1_Dr00027693 [Drosera rotundifolia]
MLKLMSEKVGDESKSGVLLLRFSVATSFATHHCLRDPFLGEHFHLVPTTPLDLVFTTTSPDLVPTVAQVAVSWRLVMMYGDRVQLVS